ncbi:HAD family hydrolase [Nitrosarchaeum koreense]|uniref:HAD family hydrolase n=1 Tax=Nitrosarchaeum koreense TaxID=1088740 RepID=UPI00064F86B2|nr:HAD hydrolase-like protein [Nitrosarchaeum koreense]
MINLIILDFDDTITDNRLLDFKAFEIPCKNLGIHPPSLKMISSSRKKGLLARDIMQKHLKKIGKSNLLSDFLSKRDTFLSDSKSMYHLQLKKHVIPILSLLKRKKIKCILCSARKNKQMVKSFLKYNKIDSYFFTTYFMHDLGFVIDNIVRSNRVLIKTSLLKQIIKDEHIDPQRVLYVGNSSEDLEAATLLKIHFVYVENDYLNKESDLDITRISNMIDLKQQIQLLVLK